MEVGIAAGELADTLASKETSSLVLCKQVRSTALAVVGELAVSSEFVAVSLSVANKSTSVQRVERLVGLALLGAV